MWEPRICNEAPSLLPSFGPCGDLQQGSCRRGFRLPLWNSTSTSSTNWRHLAAGLGPLHHPEDQTNMKMTVTRWLHLCFTSFRSGI